MTRPPPALRRAVLRASFIARDFRERPAEERDARDRRMHARSRGQRAGPHSRPSDRARRGPSRKWLSVRRLPAGTPQRIRLHRCTVGRLFCTITLRDRRSLFAQHDSVRSHGHVESSSLQGVESASLATYNAGLFQKRADVRALVYGRVWRKYYPATGSCAPASVPHTRPAPRLSESAARGRVLHLRSRIRLRATPRTGPRPGFLATRSTLPAAPRSRATPRACVHLEGAARSTIRFSHAGGETVPYAEEQHAHWLAAVRTR